MRWLLFIAVVALIGVLLYERARKSVLSVPSGPATDAEGNPLEPDYTPGDDPIGLFMKAVAIAEGSDTAWNNPGDLTTSFGFPVVGRANSAGVLMFDTMNHGWGALRAQLELIAGGGSHVYTPSMSIADMAVKYTGGDQANSWASNVAETLGVDPSTSIGDLLGSASS